MLPYNKLLFNKFYHFLSLYVRRKHKPSVKLQSVGTNRSNRFLTSATRSHICTRFVCYLHSKTSSPIIILLIPHLLVIHQWFIIAMYFILHFAYCGVSYYIILYCIVSYRIVSYHIVFIWYDMIWYDMIWYDMMWYDMVWYYMILSPRLWARGY